MVVAGRHVGDHRTQDVEGRLVAPLHLAADVHLDLVHGHVARPFDHHLAPQGFRPAGELTHHFELGELGLVAGVGHRAGAKAVAQAPGDVAVAHDLAQLVEVGIERVFEAVGRHPLGHQRPAAADNAGQPLLGKRHVLSQQRAVDGHVVDALPGLLLDDVQEVPRLHVEDVVELLDHLVDRHGAHRNGDRIEDPAADGVDLVARREVHHRVGPVTDCRADLFELAIRVAHQRRVSQVGVDLGPPGDADAERHEAVFQMCPVGGDDHASPGDFVSDRFRGEPFALGDGFHLGRDRTGDGLLELGCHKRALRRRKGAAATPLDFILARCGRVSTGRDRGARSVEWTAGARFSIAGGQRPPGGPAAGLLPAIRQACADGIDV